jgi:23S rRNA (uracil747-C5)-methyltransferase
MKSLGGSPQMECEYYQNKICQSCDELPLGLTASALQKQARIQSMYSGNTVQPIVVVDDAKASRNKAKLIVSGSLENAHIGFINHQQQFVAVSHCPLYHPEVHTLILKLQKLIPRYQLTPYNIESKKGELKGLIIFRNPVDGHIMLRFILRSMEAFERIKKLYLQELKNDQTMGVVSYNLQPEHKASLEGEKEIIISQQQTLAIQFENIKLRLGPKSFFQTNSAIAQRLYQTIGEQVQNLKLQHGLELYCGVGAIGLICSRYLISVTGVEISQEAVNFANQAALENAINNAQFYAEDALAFYRANHQKYDVVILNPPRRGLGVELTQLLKERKTPFIIYSSCNPESQKRDLDLLIDDYTIRYIQPFDMFPLTSHLENLIILAKKDI